MKNPHICALRHFPESARELCDNFSLNHAVWEIFTIHTRLGRSCERGNEFAFFSVRRDMTQSSPFSRKTSRNLSVDKRIS